MEIRNKKGFSLVESLVTIFIFVLIILVSIGAFVSLNIYRKRAKDMQAKMETARTVMEMMAKKIRVSTNVAYENDIAAKTSKLWAVYYPNNNPYCMYYEFDFSDPKNLVLYSAERNYQDPDNCRNSGIDLPENNFKKVLASGLKGKFFAIKTDKSTSTIGRATISIELEGSFLQTTAAFRDYRGIIQ